MTSAEESVVNQVVAAVEHAGERLKGFSVTFKFSDGNSEMTVWGPGKVADAVQEPEAVGGGDAQGQAAPEASEEASEAPMSKGKRKK